MKQLFTILIFLFSISNISAQNYADKEYYLIDSLDLNELDSIDLLNLDNGLKDIHSVSDYKSKIKYLNLITFSLNDYKIKEKYGELSKKWILDNINNIGNDDSLNIFYTQALASYYSGKGMMQSMSYNNSDSAIVLFNRALDLYAKIDEKRGVATVLSDIGYEYNLKGDIIEAINYYGKAIVISEKLTSIEGLYIHTYNLTYIAKMNLRIKNYEEALEQSERAYSLADSLQNNELINLAINLKSDILFRQENFEESYQTSLKALTFAKETNRKLLLGSSYLALGISAYALNKMDEAEEYINLAIANVGEYNNYLPRALVQLAIIKLDQNKLNEALKSAKEAISLSENIEVNIDASDVIFNVYKKRNNFVEATEWLEYKLDYVLKKNDEKNVESIVKQGVAYSYNKQKEIDDLKNEQKLEITEQQKQKTRMGMIAAGIIALLIGIFSIYTFNRLKLIRAQKNKLDKAYVDLDAAYLKLEESTKNELAVSNLKALKAQMNPHFIFNLLNSIQGLVLRGDIDASYTYMTKFATLVRQTLNFSDVDLVDLEDEIDLLRIYLDLEKLRFSEDFEYQIFDNDIEDIKIPPLLIQPFIENALVHGLLHKKGSKTLKIVFELKDQLICTITDNGVGRIKSKEIKARQDVQHESFSTQAIEKRFKILSETYKGQFGFKYEDVFEGDVLIATQVKLHIPFKRIF